jgi:hypothetical protein
MKTCLLKKNLKRSAVTYGVLLLFMCISIIPSIAGVLNGQVPVPPTVATTGKSSEGDIPTWYQGDQWIYTVDPLYYSGPNGSFSGTIENFKQKVVGITDGMYDIEITGDINGDLTMSEFSGEVNGEITGTSHIRVSDLAEETTELQSQGTITVLFIPLPYQMNLVTSSIPLLELYDFPINVGEQWQLLCINTISGSFTVSGLYNQSFNEGGLISETAQCTQKEQVSVPAGAYECYKIGRTDTNTWYSTDVGNTVKSIIDESDENSTIEVTITLESFNRAAQPITISEDISPAVVFPGTSVIISGQALTTGSADPVQNGAITIEIPSTGDSWSTTTDSDGYYSKTIIAPTINDDTACIGETGSGGVIVQCVNGSLSGYRIQTLTALLNTPPDTPSIDGETKGKVDVSYSYTVVTTDSEMNEVMYYVDWGDSTNSSWVGPYSSGESITISHTFTEKGTYTIKVKARDSFLAESGWGTLQVTMPKSFSYPNLLRFLERFPFLFQLVQSLLEH